DRPPSARTGHPGGAGPAGACLAVRTSPAAVSQEPAIILVTSPATCLLPLPCLHQPLPVTSTSASAAPRPGSGALQPSRRARWTVRLGHIQGKRASASLVGDHADLAAQEPRQLVADRQVESRAAVLATRG